MNDIAIRAENLSKQYHIGSQQKTYDRIGAQLVDMFKTPLRRANKLLRGQATGAADLAAYQAHLNNELRDYEYPMAKIEEAMKDLPEVDFKE